MKKVKFILGILIFICLTNTTKVNAQEKVHFCVISFKHLIGVDLRSVVLVEKETYAVSLFVKESSCPAEYGKSTEKRGSLHFSSLCDTTSFASLNPLMIFSWDVKFTDEKGLTNYPIIPLPDLDYIYDPEKMAAIDILLEAGTYKVSKNIH